MDKTRAMRLIEREQGGELPAILFDLFERFHTSEAVCQELGISYPTLIDWLQQFGLERVREVRHITKLRPRGEEVASAR